MNEPSYTIKDLEQAFQMAWDLVSSAIHELDRSPGHAGASEAMRRGLKMIESAGKALGAGDPTQAAYNLGQANESARVALVVAKRDKTAAPAGEADLSFDLLEQTLSAIERVAHRVRNATGHHTTFGAIRTPSSEWLP